MKKTGFKTAVILLIAALCILMSACGMSGRATDPGTWGYECLVTYDALGGVINAREVRRTYYLPNSYVFAPSGSSNMLVEPVRDGYMLAGWYTAKSEAPEGSAEEYLFSESDRWDFSTDRVQGDMTLYARWLPRSKVDYINSDNGDIVFSKNITGDSPVQELSDAVLTLKKPSGMTLYGYYSDPECTEAYDFSAFAHTDPTPTEEELYASLFAQFPQYIAQEEYVVPAQKEEEDGEDELDNPWLFLNKMGYVLTTDDEAALSEIRAAKDKLIEDAIQNYLITTAECNVYLKFTEGSFVSVRHPDDLKQGTKYGFFDTDILGNPIDGYIIERDLDFSGISLAMSDSFSGTIHGNGHALLNLTVSVMSKKVDNDKEKSVGLVHTMDGATINDLTFKNCALSVQVNKGIKVVGGLLAVEATNVTFNNCRFLDLTVTGGKGDDGSARYTLGDLFGSFRDCTFNNCTAGELTANVFDPERLVLAIFTLPEPVEEETPAP